MKDIIEVRVKRESEKAREREKKRRRSNGHEGATGMELENEKESRPTTDAGWKYPVKEMWEEGRKREAREERKIQGRVGREKASKRVERELARGERERE